MQARRLNHLSSRILAALALIALTTVATGYFQSPLPDEGTAAHIFQLSVAMVAAVGALFAATADWQRPARSLRPLALPAALLLTAFAALYYLERFYYPSHYR